MKRKALLMLLAVSCAIPSLAAAKKHKIFIVSSYHREYLWDQDLQEGECAGLTEAGAFKSHADCKAFTEKDFVETPTAVVKKAWMDTKHKTKPEEIKKIAADLKKEIDAFGADIVMVSDDNGTNYIGNLYKDTKMPVVFCGVDETPLKYGLVESMNRPGHNVTGAYQRGYYREGAEALAKIVPSAKTFAVLADDSETSRAKIKGVEEAAAEPGFPLQLAGTVHTNSFKEFKEKALELSKKVDAFLVINHNTIKDDAGKPVDQMTVGNWYLNNIKKPEFSGEKQFVQEGMLVVADDSGYRQAYAMVKMGYRILNRGDNPAEMPTQHPPRGPIIVNRRRAEMLGLKVDNLAEQYIDKAIALEPKS